MPLLTTNKFRGDAHYGWHWRGEGNFFEGWYYRLTLPQQGHCFAFMYEISLRQRQSQLQGAMQVLGGDDQLIFAELDQRGKFAVSYQDLALRYTPAVDLSSTLT
jgi:tocopherol cyclase